MINKESEGKQKITNRLAKRSAAAMRHLQKQTLQKIISLCLGIIVLAALLPGVAF